MTGKGSVASSLAALAETGPTAGEAGGLGIRGAGHHIPFLLADRGATLPRSL